MNLLNIITGKFRKAGLKNGGEYTGSCPWCGGEGNRRAGDPYPNRFHIWPEQGSNGTYWCRQCGRGGDAIKYLIDHEGMEFKAALDYLGLDPSVLGNRADKVPTGWRPSAVIRPADVWADHARKFVDWCHERLLERPLEIDWLQQRGIGMEMIKKYSLGYNPAHAWREGSAWGVSMPKKENGKLKKLWLPRGLVIPMIAESGQVLRLRIRQPDQSPRYMVIPGSCREPLCSRTDEAMIVVESELDAILLDGLAGDLAGVVAMGNDTAKPTASLMPALESALTIIVSMDSDLPKYNPDTGTMDMPGAKASRWWLDQFPRAIRVPVIGGKDPGEAYQAGVDLRQWVLAALPPYFHVKADLEAERQKRKKAVQGVAVVSGKPEETNQEEMEVEPPAVEQEEVPRESTTQKPDTPSEKEIQDGLQGPMVKTVTLKNGRSFCLTSDQEEWQRLTDAGELVFSEHELKRLQSACAGMDKEERLAAAMLVLDIKKIFAPAWIRRGEVIVDTGVVDAR